jgi:hypothetical protein
MKIDGLDWMDWLHKIRQDMENQRKRRGESEVEWLKEIQADARAFMCERSTQPAVMARDGKKDA